MIVGLFASFGMAQNANDGPAVELTDWWSNDLGPSPPNPVSFDPPEREKDVAWSEGQLQDTDADSLKDHFQFSIHNGYPGYECQLNLTVHNAGNETLWIWIGEGESTVTSSSPSEISVSGLSFSSTELAADDHEDGGADEAVVIFTVTVLEGAEQGQEGPTGDYLNVIDGDIVVKNVPEPEPG